MAKPRQRYDESGRPKPCDVRIWPQLAVFLYRECRKRGYRDETELVNAIIRAWSEGMEPVNWPELYQQMRAEEEKEEGGAAGKAG
jgi:hypothetical protein